MLSRNRQDATARHRNLLRLWCGEIAVDCQIDRRRSLKRQPKKMHAPSTAWEPTGYPLYDYYLLAARLPYRTSGRRHGRLQSQIEAGFFFPPGGLLHKQGPMSIVYCILSIGCCLLPIACCLLAIVYCLLFIAYCLLAIVYCLLFFVYCLLSIVYCLLFIVYCLLSLPRGFQ